MGENLLDLIAASGAAVEGERHAEQLFLGYLASGMATVFEPCILGEAYQIL